MTGTSSEPTQSASQDIITALRNILNLLTPEQQEEIETDANNIEDGVSALAATTTTADNEASALLLKQDQVKDILDAENTRIQTNIQRTADTLNTKKRMMNFTENSRLYTEQYNKILYIILLTLSVIIMLIVGFKYVPFLPDIILQILVVLIGGIGSVTAFKVYNDMQSRSPLNYNELNLEKPIVLSPEELIAKRKAAAKSGNLLGSIDVGGCNAADCCDTENGVVWDGEYCKIADTSDTTTTESGSSETFTVERMKYNIGIAPPNTPSEINMYSKV